jgi:glycosyltransferase 2 family protein
MTKVHTSLAQPRTIRRADTLVFLAKIAMSASLLGLCFYLIDFQHPFDAVAAINPLLLTTAFVCGTLGTIILPAYITRHALVISKISLSLRDLIIMNFAIRFYAIIMPRIVSVWLRWKRYGEGSLTGTAFALLVFERVIQLATLCLFAFAALFFERGKLGVEGDGLTLLTFIMTLFSFALLAPFLSTRVATQLDRFVPLGMRLLPKFVSSRLARLVELITAFRDLETGVVLRISVISALAFLLFVASSYILAGALGIAVSFVALIWIRSLVFMLTLIPISVAGIGLREIGFAGLLALYGIDMPTAIAFSFANFGLQLGMAAIGAGFEGHRFFIKRRQRATDGSMEGNIAL